MPLTLLRKNNRRAGTGGIQGTAGGRGYAGGQYIPTVLWQRERATAEAALPGLVRSFSEELQYLRLAYEQVAVLPEGTTILLPLVLTESRMKLAIIRAYEAAYTLGRRACGNLLSLTPEDEARVGALARDEFNYLEAFARDMASGGGHMDYAQRMDYYAGAARELYWAGWATGDTDPARRITWTLGATEEHCPDCSRLAAGSPYAMAEFVTACVDTGYLPQSGKLACKGFYCRCRLVSPS